MKIRHKDITASEYVDDESRWIIRVYDAANGSWYWLRQADILGVRANEEGLDGKVILSGGAVLSVGAEAIGDILHVLTWEDQEQE